ncbi:hypothetical protein TGME49_206480 [Toxoplasma gondii ME49]|uniref:Uncharacterized protein n=14 Tax=Toxoplasma gondii TaxID=5811 RepID=B9PZY8_TOXGV|nr:hypothetical protein TGME49_206480 [Toxoplasma gondii ME49]EPR61344.1 hypothetical protein TGGT1_206480 [Toxoplasma gondii GT1]ESS33324.1 hypothetical protein TGVEG_206480 [Toxoplasma gondii VEG]KAF4642628.1 hypothetical protein TGRH88_033530 [Toxoplasma gondii]KYF44512.1 hypothetical protein TGARI_206480 [Toxoplasma gondii ARI]PIM02334.1 hypothetical protein TGCOUG_206480 [Toxoplasma gondii COUG]RQX72951.1 hypothetical protein TGCAST_206480 [Toxoplasma gondii CAST]|eukprot:XP_002367829.1 hypothetical protein TGME49_206480 [Toxoplasma gondii ME49]
MAFSGLAAMASPPAATRAQLVSRRFLSGRLACPSAVSLTSGAPFSFAGAGPFSRCSILTRNPAASPSCLSIQTRFLGNRATGPQFDILDPKSINLREEARYVCRLFSVPTLNYLDFKQGCSSLRVFLFLAMMAGISLDLLLFHPPKSSYWNRFHLHRLPLNAERLLFPGKGNVYEYTKNGTKVDPDTGAVATEACASFLKLMYGVSL